MKLWGGRFRKKTAPELERLGRSIHFDRRLGAEDVEINRVYARALERAGYLSAYERQTIESGLAKVAVRLASEPEPFLPEDEDIHTAVERMLCEEVGDVSGKLPAGRSRNDLSATELRLYLAKSARALSAEVRALQETLLSRAEASRAHILPGYTHLRRGQPVVFAQYFLAYFWALGRDRERLDRAGARALELPLGAGALAGNPLGVDRDSLAADLGFPGVLENSIDAVSTRDHVLEFLAACAILATQLSRMSEDLILWSTDEFGFIEIDEAYATGSSIMPQKRNPDGLELIRGKSGRVVGDLMSLLTSVKGVATGYQRDLQEDKEPAFDAIDTLSTALPVMRGIVATLGVRESALRRALSPDLLATDLAEYLVRKGVPFREAHRIVGEILAHAVEQGQEPPGLPIEALRRFSQAFEEDVQEVWDYRASVERKLSRGGVASKALDEQFRRARQSLS